MSFPAIWDAARAETPGMPSRSAEWWDVRRLDDSPRVRRGRGFLQRVLLEVEGAAAGYALYRHEGRWEQKLPTGSIDVLEAVGATDEATRALWRYLFDIDLAVRIKANLLPADHPLLLLMAEPARLRAQLTHGLWVRLVDVGAALSGRGYEGKSELVLEVSDSFCPWNEGRWQLGGGVAARTDGEPDLSLDAAALGSAYLGGFSFSQLVRAGRVKEHRGGALERADALFRATRTPWCPEIF